MFIETPKEGSKEQHWRQWHNVYPTQIDEITRHFFILYIFFNQMLWLISHKSLCVAITYTTLKKKHARPQVPHIACTSCGFRL